MLPFAVGERGGRDGGEERETDGGRGSGWARREGGREGKWVGEEGGREGGEVGGKRREGGREEGGDLNALVDAAVGRRRRRWNCGISGREGKANGILAAWLIE